jgi:AcrR family transcriptional regulator
MSARAKSPAKEASRRADDTRTALLDAARAAFIESSYDEANVLDVVKRAGSSVGSMYHHFGGKPDLYVALYGDYHTRQEERAKAAVRAARNRGETDEVTLFVAGARAYLQGCWEERDLTRLWQMGGGPAGFSIIGGQRFHTWLRKNAEVLGADHSSLGEALALVLTSVVHAAGVEVALHSTRRKAMRLADNVLTLIERIARPEE